MFLPINPWEKIITLDVSVEGHQYVADTGFSTRWGGSPNGAFTLHETGARNGRGTTGTGTRTEKMCIEPIAKFPIPVPPPSPSSLSVQYEHVYIIYRNPFFSVPVPCPGSVQCERAIKGGFNLLFGQFFPKTTSK